MRCDLFKVSGGAHFLHYCGARTNEPGRIKVETTEDLLCSGKGMSAWAYFLTQGDQS